VQQIFGNIADGMEPGVSGLCHAFKMAGLGNGATSKNANLQLPVRL
jgi:hypothetical protein